MSKLAIVYWSGTGNTEAMAAAVSDGARKAGAEVSLMTVSDFDPAMLSSPTQSPSAAPRWAQRSWRTANSRRCSAPVSRP